MPWSLIRVDGDTREAIRTDCTCADHCKAVARKARKTEAGYNHAMRFQILAPYGQPYADTIDTKGWRIRWGYL